ncbi:uncharacterized protein LOC111674178 [Orussus abietinus]|uniref:uncharacterized protein LOC111674178 n=1 Tax=Orussus abietinus TaxID=222816 RepID=UPI000C715C9B|nr:uncharacterized protein LOC111674178 [Orussus abietinus]
MRTILTHILFFTGLVHGMYTDGVEQTTMGPGRISATKASSRYRDPLLSTTWSNRTSPSNSVRGRSFSVARQSPERPQTTRRSRKKEETEEPRMFSTLIQPPDRRPSDEKPPEFQRRNVRLRTKIPGGRYTAPSPILLPPYKSYSPEYNFDEEKNGDPTALDADLQVTTLPPNTTPRRIRIYEITTAKPLNVTDSAPNKDQNPPEDPETNQPKSTPGSLDVVERPVTPEASDAINGPEDYSSGTTSTHQRNVYSSYDDGSVTVKALRVRLNGGSVDESSWESARYRQDTEDEEPPRRPEVTSLPTKKNVHWRKRPTELPNHFKVLGAARKVGAIPGVPGRDYPVHRQHTHHRLRYNTNRFPCPVAPGTHIYLADRASRCQIFYVCYGDQNGVPMTCPNGTLFNESLQVCDWWFNVAC